MGFLSAVGNFAKKTFNTAVDTVGDVAKGAASVAGKVADTALKVVTAPYSLLKDGILDLVKHQPTATAVPGATNALPTGNLNNINDRIAQLQNKMNGEGLSDNEIFELQNLMQERLQLMSLLTNLLKMEHDGQMAIVNNIR